MIDVPIRRLGIGVALALLVAACAAPAASAPVPAPAAAENELGLGEQSSEAESVTLVAGWLSGDVPSARVAMDTHSVDLDRFDLRELARVRLDGGAWVAPSAWDAPKGGHHREGTLTFGRLGRASFDAATVVELEIRGVATPSRVLRWERPR